MPSRKTAKLVVLELLQAAALVAPPLAVAERLARLLRVRHGETSYWLVVAASVAYVTSATLLVWLPLRYTVLRRRSRTSTAEKRHWWVLRCTDYRVETLMALTGFLPRLNSKLLNAFQSLTSCVHAIKNEPF